MGGGGIIFNIVLYIKNQYSEDKFYGLILIVIAAIFTLLFCIYFIKPIIDWIFINILHKRECSNNDEKFISNHLCRIIKFKINKKLEQEESNNGKIIKIIEELNNNE